LENQGITLIAGYLWEESATAGRSLRRG